MGVCVCMANVESCAEERHPMRSKRPIARQELMLLRCVVVLMVYGRGAAAAIANSLRRLKNNKTVGSYC